jgi:hypothetical protein
MISRVAGRLAAASRRFGSGVAHGDGHEHEQGHGHGHGHDHHHYDWRDDPKVNKDLTEDWANRGFPDPEHYHFPVHFQGNMCTDSYFPASYNPKDLTMNLVPGWRHIYQASLPPSAAEMNMWHDINHEIEHESEDFDLQGESIELQHFRKKGNIWQWWIVGALPLLWFYGEFVIEKLPDEDHWKKAMPPPLHYVDAYETPDQEMFDLWNTRDHQLVYEAGMLAKPWFKIENGKKIYLPHSGTNQPMADI